MRLGRTGAEEYERDTSPTSVAMLISLLIQFGSKAFIRGIKSCFLLKIPRSMLSSRNTCNHRWQPRRLIDYVLFLTSFLYLSNNIQESLNDILTPNKLRHILCVCKGTPEIKCGSVVLRGRCKDVSRDEYHKRNLKTVLLSPAGVFCYFPHQEGFC